MALDSQVVHLRVGSTLSGSAGLATVSAPIDQIWDASYSNGTGSGQCDVVFSTSYTIGTGATQSIDVTGTLTNALGATVTLAKIKVLAIRSRGTNTTNVTISRPASNGLVLFGAASGSLSALEPNGKFLFDSPVAGVAVTAATGDLLSITNASGASAVVDVYIAGTSV